MKEVYELTKSLIRTRSDKDRKDEREKALKLLEGRIKERAASTVKYEYLEEEGTRSLYVTNPAAQGEEVLMCGHVDVIPASDEQFEPKEDEEYLHGRGAGDMKAGIALMTELFIKHHKDKKVSLLITTDEEIGSPHGASHAADHLEPAMAIIPEPTENHVVLNQKGGTWVEITVKGPGGHASRPWQATNAVDILLDIIQKLREKRPHPKEDAWTDTMNIGSIKGGNLEVKDGEIAMGGANVIADNATAKLDFRITEETSHEDVWNDVEAAVSEAKERYGEDNPLTWRKLTRIAHLATDEDDPKVKAFMDACKRATGSAETAKEHGASDGRFFSSKGVPTIV